MAFSNIALTNTFDEWRTLTNQLVVLLNNINETEYTKATGNVKITGVTNGETLNLVNGYIKANGAGLTFLPNTSIQGLIRNAQLQHSSITITSSGAEALTITGTDSLGGTVTITLATSNDQTSTATSTVPTSKALSNVYTVATTANTQAFAAPGISNSYATAVGAAGNNRSLANATGTVFNGNLIISQNLTTGFTASNTNTSVIRIATGSEFRTGTSRALALGVADVWDSTAEVSIADSATITMNMATGFNFNVNLVSQATRTLATPTNMKVGQSGYIRIKQGGATAQTFSSYGTGWNFASGTTPTLSTGAGNTDLLFYQVLSTANVFGSLIKDIRLNY